MRLCLLPTDNLVHKSYQDNLISDANQHKTWRQCIQTLLNNFEGENLWENHGRMCGSTYSNPFQKKIEDSYTDLWLEHINRNDENKLRNYSEFTTFTPESYILSCDLIMT